MRWMRRRNMVLAIVLSFLLVASGCGSIMHPERMTETRSDKLDAKIVALNAAWLLVGIIPGFVAFGVDIVNETLWFSEEELEARPQDETPLEAQEAISDGSLVTFRLLDAGGQELVPPASVQYQAGSSADSRIVLPVPRETELSGATLVLSVEGQPRRSWALQ